MTLIAFPGAIAGVSVSAVADAESSVSIMRKEEIETLPRAEAAVLRKARHEDIRTLPHARHHHRRHPSKRIHAIGDRGGGRTLCQRRLDRDPPRASLRNMATRHDPIGEMSDVPGLTTWQGTAEAIRVQTH
ncbi:hypothetical protein [Paracoccus sp. ME4]|uniref:hypothetical protein n=1 Tax=Paracoccus sp. ME4 TaxID=3138066 RepID=UPI00398B528B